MNSSTKVISHSNSLSLAIKGVKDSLFMKSVSFLGDSIQSLVDQLTAFQNFSFNKIKILQTEALSK